MEQGYLLLPGAFECIGAGDLARAYATFCQAAAIVARFGDADLVALARHVSNIFNKLGLSSRAAATAYAYQHGLA